MTARTRKFFGIAAALTALVLFVVKSSGESRDQKSVPSASIGRPLSPSRTAAPQETAFKSVSHRTSADILSGTDVETFHISSHPQAHPLPLPAFNFSIAGNHEPLVINPAIAASSGTNAPNKPATTETIASVDPSAPGNSFTALDRNVRISSIERTPAGDSLNILISDNEDSGSNISEAPASQSNHRGFTYEQELFRTKWGWTAFNRVHGTVADDSITTP